MGNPPNVLMRNVIYCFNLHILLQFSSRKCFCNKFNQIILVSSVGLQPPTRLIDAHCVGTTSTASAVITS